MTLVGDAAHTHGGAHAAGGSLALDDAYALFLSISHVFPASSTSKLSGPAIRQALTLYEETRKPHTERLLKTVHASRRATAPQNDEELRHKMLSRADTAWLSEHDVEIAFAKVLEAHGNQTLSDKDVLEARL